MNIAIGSDHRGFTFKKDIISLLTAAGYGYHDFGAYSEDSVDYPDIALAAGKAVAEGKFERGILICYTGIGMSISANKVRGIRAALCHNAEGARMTRLHNDANILCLGVIDGSEKVPEIVKTFLTTQFEGGRHIQRVEKIRKMEC